MIAGGQRRGRKINGPRGIRIRALRDDQVPTSSSATPPGDSGFLLGRSTRTISLSLSLLLPRTADFTRRRGVVIREPIDRVRRLSVGWARYTCRRTQLVQRGRSRGGIDDRVDVTTSDRVYTQARGPNYYFAASFCRYNNYVTPGGPRNTSSRPSRYSTLYPLGCEIPSPRRFIIDTDQRSPPPSPPLRYSPRYAIRDPNLQKSRSPFASSTL